MSGDIKKKWIYPPNPQREIKELVSDTLVHLLNSLQFVAQCMV